MASGRVKKPTRRGEAGFTLLELIVVVGLVAILFTVGLNKYFDLLVDVERATMEQTVGSMRSALAMQVANRIVRGDIGSIRSLAETNPMNYLAERPKNYLGELQNADPSAIEGGDWYFEKSGDYLVYRVKYSRYFRSPLAGPPRVRLRIDPVYTDDNGSGRFEAKKEVLEGLRIAELDTYQWLKTPKGKEE